jgi:mRNA-degrading endonuclease RelE of RelBE toxin-antitoxin system
MSCNIISTRKFEKELKRLIKKFPSLKAEFIKLVKNIELNPNLGIALGNNCYKIRLAITSKGKGKSGGARVITHLYVSSETIYLLTVYDKSEKSNLTNTELNELIKSLDILY